MRHEAGGRYGRPRAWEFDSPRGHMDSDGTDGYVGLMCVFMSAGCIIGLFIAILIVAIWEEDRN